MKLCSPRAELFVPDARVAPTLAMERTSHLCIGAHPDDIEAMAYAGIAHCFGRSDRWFSGITVTDGAGSARTGHYARFSDEEMRQVRRAEQRKAAVIGEYSMQIQFGYSSAEVKQREVPTLHDDLVALLRAMHPEVVYLHQPADKHDTHVAVLGHSIRALRALPLNERPRQVFGCEGWRNLDWLSDDEKQLLDASAFPGVAASLMGVFDSQNTGGKRFDLAIPARRCANATFHNPHTADQYAGITWATDLTPLVRDSSLSVVEFAQGQIDRFRADVTKRGARFL